jgi:hypothetical protein
LILSLLVVFGMPVLWWLTFGHPNAWVLWMLGGFLFLVGVVSVLVAIHGCESCVITLLGDFSI